MAAPIIIQPLGRSGSGLDALLQSQLLRAAQNNNRRSDFRFRERDQNDDLQLLALLSSISGQQTAAANQASQFTSSQNFLGEQNRLDRQVAAERAAAGDTALTREFDLRKEQFGAQADQISEGIETSKVKRGLFSQQGKDLQQQTRLLQSSRLLDTDRQLRISALKAEQDRLGIGATTAVRNFDLGFERGQAVARSPSIRFSRALQRAKSAKTLDRRGVNELAGALDTYVDAIGKSLSETGSLAAGGVTAGEFQGLTNGLDVFAKELEALRGTEDDSVQKLLTPLRDKFQDFASKAAAFKAVNARNPAEAFVSESDASKLAGLDAQAGANAARQRFSLGSEDPKADILALARQLRLDRSGPGQRETFVGPDGQIDPALLAQFTRGVRPSPQASAPTTGVGRLDRDIVDIGQDFRDRRQERIGARQQFAEEGRPFSAIMQALANPLLQAADVASTGGETLFNRFAAEVARTLGEPGAPVTHARPTPPPQPVGSFIDAARPNIPVRGQVPSPAPSNRAGSPEDNISIIRPDGQTVVVKRKTLTPDRIAELRAAGFTIPGAP